MEAWILHIEEVYQVDDNKPTSKHAYSVWSTEKQAYKNAGKFLSEQCKLMWSGTFKDHDSLRIAVGTLVDLEKIPEAINLANDHSETTPNTKSGAGSNKVLIKIIKSKFLGSVFE
jgi:hypothetical protein